MMIIHYEVYVLESRGWMLHARFPRSEREEALAEAKELEQHGMKVRVVRESYHTDTNTFDEADIYVTGKKDAKQSRREQPAPARPASRPSAGPAQAKRPPPTPAAAKSSLPERKPEPAKKQPEAKTASQVVGRLLVILAFALVMATMAVKATPKVIMTLWGWGFGINVHNENYPAILVGVFILTFLLVAVPLALRFLPRQAEVKIRHRQPAPEAEVDPAEIQRSKEVKRSLDKLAREALAEEVLASLKAAGEIPAALPAEDPFPPQPVPPPQPAGLDVPPPIPAPDFGATAEPPPFPTAPEPPQAVPAPPPDAPIPVPVPPQTAAADAHRPTLLRFISGALNAIKAFALRLDNYNKFALHLYLAGGVDTLCEVNRLGERDRRQLTGNALEQLGTAGEIGERFQDRLPEYLLEPRYMRVVQAGRNAMTDFLDGREDAAHRELEGAIKEWERPTQSKTSVVTVMFTDMVGSTDLTQAKGDAAAQEVVRRHNGIVRAAIAKQSGREIKHTGDGIMASFPSASGAVDAAAEIQRNVAVHNDLNPGLRMQLRIGLNAGEPIEEEDDLYGSTVQLAARVCAATKPEQILCTGVVKELASGKGGAFISAGSQTLKGFRDPITLYEVTWKD